MTDIFHEWRQHRFIVADYALLEKPDIIVVLTDIGFWAEHLDELQIWCKENNAVQAGMTVELVDDEQLLLFCLRWS